MSEERTVSMGCGSIFFAALLIGALWGIEGALSRISSHLMEANALRCEAAHE